MAIAIVAVLNVNLSSTETGMSDFLLANVEALAQENNNQQPDSNKWSSLTYDCFNSQGLPNGKKATTCFSPGFSSSCSSTSC